MSASNWWMFHGDPAHTGLVTGSPIKSSNAGKLKLLHEVPIAGPVLSVPAVVDGYVYVGLANSHELPGANGGQFLKINAAKGKIERKFDWEIQPQEGDTHGFMGMGCTPAVANGKVYFSAFNGKLYCLDENTLKPVWITDLRHSDLSHNQPVSNTLLWNAGDPPAAGWSSPLVVNGNVYVGMGEGENPALFGFIYCLDAETGNAKWIYCTCQFSQNVPNQPNVLPPSVLVQGAVPPAPFSAGPVNPAVRGCSVWSSIAYDQSLNRIYCATGNPSPDSVLPTNGFSNGILSLDATTGEYKGFFQAPPESSYRATDNDVDFGGSPMVFTLNQRRVVAAGCKNGGFFLLDADSLKLLGMRQLLPYYNNGKQIPTVDPHVDASNNQLDPRVPNKKSDEIDQENYSGTYSTPALHPGLGRLFMGVGGNNYHNVAAGIDFTTTPFLRALDWNTLADAWPMDNNDPRRYLQARPPMYTTPGESGLSSPAVVNDVVFCSTSKVAVYAFEAKTGEVLWQDQLGLETGGANGGYGYCLGPAIAGKYVVAGALVFGHKTGGVLRIYTL